MQNKFSWILILAVLLLGASFFRLWRLNDRPMHTDEAVHAKKMGTLLEEGAYIYNPDEYHGPTLNYSTLIPAIVRGEKSLAQLNESTLRIVPAVYGILLCLTPLFYLRDIGKRAVLLCIVLIAFSPAFTFYSRYYIQEMLLVFFTACFLGCLWNWLRDGGLYWPIFTGISVGLMHATKETFVFALVALIPALLYYRFVEKKAGLKTVKLSGIIALIISTIIVSAAFFSSFGTNPHGIIDSITTYSNWAARAGDHSIHSHPWHYYLDLITWLEFIEPLSWNEDVIIAFALLGLFTAFKFYRNSKYGFLRFFSLFTCSLLFIYSAIAYKTPWCMLTFLYGMVLIAGFVCGEMYDAVSGYVSHILLSFLLLVYAFAGPIYQSFQLNFKYYADQTNPYVYAHTTNDIYPMTDAVNRAVIASGDNNASVFVISDDCNYWPFPWYLRRLNNVGYWNTIDSSVCNATVILARADHEKQLLNTLYSVPPAGQRHLYVPLFDKQYQLRPAVPWRGYIRKDLADKMLKDSIKEVNVKPNQQTEQFKPEVSKDDIPHLMKFTHTAMNTNFAVFIQDQRGTYSGRAARTAFNEVDKLESQLSKFIENSDVSRINKLNPGEFELIDIDTFKCLQIALDAKKITNGAFDITLGKVFQAWKDNEPDKAKAIFDDIQSGPALELDSDSYVVKSLKENVTIDLGGIGKGFAIDKIAEVLKEWGITKALIHGGSSSVYALDAPDNSAGWPVTLSHPDTNETLYRLNLQNEILSCSGIRFGRHVINPATGTPITDRQMCWIKTSQNAAMADALSTAAMIMPMEDINKLSNEIPGFAAIIFPLDQSGKTSDQITIGSWE